MDSLNHLKTTYRPRFFNREGKKKAVGIQGENVLECIQDCFETCAKEFTECSPSISCGSFPSLDQVPCHSKEKEQTKLELAEANCVNNVVSTLTFLLSPGRIERFSGSNESEEILDEDIDVLPLGSPALLLEEEGEQSCVERLCFDEEALDLHNSKNFSKSKGFCAGKETKELHIEEPTSGQIKMSGSLSSLEAMTSALAVRNAANVELEEECEFLIEESFGASSASWISTSRKKQKPEKKRLIAVSFEGNKEAQQHNERRKDKRELGKTVMPTPVKQIKATLSNVGERTFDRLQNASRTNEVMAVENVQSQLVINTTQETRKQMNSKNKVKDSAEIHNRGYQDPINRKQAQGLTPLLEPDQSLLIQIQPVESTEQSLSQNKLTTLTEVHNENQQEFTVSVLSSKHCTQSKNTDTYSENLGSVPRPVPLAQQLCCGTPVRKQKLPSQKQLGTQKKKKKSTVGPRRRKNRRLVSEKSLEGDIGEEQLDKKDENLHAFELRRTDIRRATPQKVKQTSFLKSKGNILCQEDSCEQHVAEKHLNASVRQGNSDEFLLESCASDENKNNRFDVAQFIVMKCLQENGIHLIRMLLVQCRGSPRPEKYFKGSSRVKKLRKAGSDPQQVVSKDESTDLEDNLNGLVSNSLKHKLVLPTNTPNVRRTKRIRIKPLEYWRGERVDYKARASGGFVFGGIVSPEQREPGKPKPKVTRKLVLEMENMHDNSISLKDLSQPAVVFDKASNQEILLECVNNGSSHMFCINNEALSIYKYLSTPSFSAGKMILEPLKEKGYQYSHTDTLVFHISCGKLLLTLYDQNYCLTAGNYFFIPPGNIYNIRNLLNKECVILFTQLKGKDQESNL
ncbi:centromere protein C [Candoia aspera]|uniref:centromere protein C n=1 Tax=Candoia aspera TaxID=51853 RepID=UPI002FD7FFF5